MAENDPRGSISLLTPILDPIDSSITPEKVESGDYTAPQITTSEERLLLPPKTKFEFIDPRDPSVTKILERNDSDVPRIDIKTGYTEAYDSLPTGAYFYDIDGLNLYKKDAEPKTLVERGFERLIGADIDARGFGIEIPRIVSTVTGGMVGSRLGLMTPTIANPLGVAIKGTGVLALGGLGSAIGAIMPEQTLEWGEKFGLIPEGTRDQYGYTDEELRTLFMGEGLLDMAFGAGFSGLRAVGRPAVKFGARISEDSAKLAQQAKDRGIAMLPVMLGDSPVARGYVSVMGRFPFFGTPFKKGGTAAVENYKSLVENIPTRMGPLVGLNELSNRIFKEASNYVKQVETDFSNAYTSIYKRAEEAGVRVIPENSLSEATRIKNQILATRTQLADGSFGQLSSEAASFVNFLDKEILNLKQGAVRTNAAPTFRRNPQTGLQETVYETVPVRLEGGETLAGAPQTMESMDGIAGRLDTFMSSTRQQLNGKLPENFGEYYSTLGNSIKGDVVGNLVENAGKNAETGLDIYKRNPQGATGSIGYELQLLDKDFSQTMNALFETSGAKMFEGVRRGGLRGTTAPSQEALRKNVDTFAQSLLTEIPKSPASILELRRIVGPETFNMIGAEYLNKAILQATDSKTGILRTDVLRKKLGFDNPNGPEAKGLEALFSGMRASPDLEDVNKILSIPELETILNIGDSISKLEIPDVSTFIARRAVMGGPSSAAKSFTPFNVATGTAAGAGATTLFGAVPLMITLTGIAGARGISSMLSNPSTALPLKKVLQEEAEGIVGKQNFARVARGVIRSLGATGAATLEEVSEMLGEFDGIYDKLLEIEEDPSLLQNTSPAIDEIEESIATPVAVIEPPPPFDAMRDNVPPPPMNVAQLPQQSTPVAVPPPRPAPQGIAAASPESRAQFAALFPNDMASGVIRSQGIGSLV